MKIRIKIILLFITILLLTTNCNFAVIEIKDTTENPLKNKTISECYDIVEEMTSAGQGLEGSNVNVKMANNYEWAVVSYFSNSNYGTGGAGNNDGVKFTTDVKEHYSSNGNVTGVMDWGKTCTFTAGIIADWKDSNGNLTIVNSTVLANGDSIIKNADTPAVDKFTNTTQGIIDIAATSWGWETSTCGTNVEYPFSCRKGLFGFVGGGRHYHWPYGAGDGNTHKNDLTFRPVFYSN